MCVNVWVHAHVCPCGGQNMPSDVFLCGFLPFYLYAESVMEPEAHYFIYQAGQSANSQGLCLLTLLGLQALTAMPAFLHACREFGLWISCLHGNCSYPPSVRHRSLFNKRFRIHFCVYRCLHFLSVPTINVFGVYISVSCRSLHACMEGSR